jgi:hypothetical protein
MVLDNVVVTVGLVSGVLAILAFFLPTQGTRPRAWHAAYVLIATILTATVVTQAHRLSRMESVSRAADQMLADREMEYGYRGFVLASLAFLEKNRDLYPESYARAKELCTSFKCGDPAAAGDMIELSSSFAGLLRGISTQAGGVQQAWWSKK